MTTQARRIARAIAFTSIVMTLPLITGQGCPTTGGVLTADAGTNLTVGVGQQIALQGAATGGSGVYSFAWSPGTGLSSTSVAQPVFSAATAGSYVFTLTVTDSLGAVSSDIVTVNVTSSTSPPTPPSGGGSTSAPLANAGPDRVTSPEAPIVLTGSASGGSGVYTYAWSPSTGLSGTSIAQPTFTPATVGTYTFTLTVTDSSGLTATDTVTVRVTESAVLASLNWGANYMAGGYQVAAVYSRALNRASAQTLSNYLISGTTTNPVSATLESDSRTVTLVFNTVLSSNSRIDLGVGGTLIDANGAITEAAANQPVLASSADAAGPTPTRVTWTANNAQSYQVEVVFSEAMDRDTTSLTSAYRISGTLIEPHSVQLAGDGQTATLTFDNQADITLSTSSKLDVSVGGQARDINGNSAPVALAQVISPSPADVTAPAIASLRHAANHGSTGYLVRALFNEVLSEADAENLAAYRISATAVAPTSAVLEGDGRTVSLIFQTPLSSADKLDISVGNTVKDINGQALVAKTAQTILASTADLSAPGVSTLTWSPSRTDDGYELQIVFTESMDRSTVQTVSGYRCHGTSVTPASAVLQADGKTVVLTFFSSLGISDSLDISVGGNFADINGRKLAMVPGHQIVNNLTDSIAPTIVSRVWAANATSYLVTVTFSEVMDRDSTNTLTNYWLGADGNFASSAVLDAAGKVLQLSFQGTPSVLNANGTLTYGYNRLDALTIDANVRDINGRACASAAVAPTASPDDAAAPAVLSVTRLESPVAGVYWVEVLFNEVVDKATAEAAVYAVGGGVNVTDQALRYDGRTVRLIVDADPAGQNVTVPNTIRDVNNQATAGGVVALP